MPWRGNPFFVHSVLNVTEFIAGNIGHLLTLDYGNLNGEAVPDKIYKLGVELLTTDPLSNKENSFAPVYSEEAPIICHLIANGDFPLREGDDVDYKAVEISDQDEGELYQAVSEAITHASKPFRTALRIISEP